MPPASERKVGSVAESLGGGWSVAESLGGGCAGFDADLIPACSAALLTFLNTQLYVYDYWDMKVDNE